MLICVRLKCLLGFSLLSSSTWNVSVAKSEHTDTLPFTYWLRCNLIFVVAPKGEGYNNFNSWSKYDILANKFVSFFNCMGNLRYLIFIVFVFKIQNSSRRFGVFNKTITFESAHVFCNVLKKTGIQQMFCWLNFSFLWCTLFTLFQIHTYVYIFILSFLIYYCLFHLTCQDRNKIYYQ